MKKKKSPSPVKKKLPAKRKSKTAASHKKKTATLKSKIKLTKHQEAEARKAHDLYWKSYIVGDLKTLASLLVDHYTQIGSVENEVFFNKKDAVKFVKTTIDQVAGNVEMRNRITKAEPMDEFILFSEQCDLYVLTEGAWTFYSKFRASSLMQQTGDGWKMIHQHSSVPDLKAQEGENIAIEKVSAENLQLRDAVKRRTVELEQKNRELAIETAMEKVRARSLAMQKPDELTEVAEVLRKEMGTLGVEELETSSIYIVDDTYGTSECWYAIKDVRGKNKKLVTDHMTLRLDETWVGRQMKKFYRSKETRVSIVMNGENRKEWINHCAEKSSVLQGYYGVEIPERTYHLVKFSNGFMGAASPGEISQESWDLLQRATAVFSFAYRRFSDLQNAESLAREAMIELALERVRARSMAMQKSEELKEVIKIVYQQLIQLKINLDHAGFVVDYTPEGDWHFWIADKQDIPSKITHPYFESVWANQFNKAKEKGVDFFVTSLNFEEKNKFYQELLSYVPGLPESSKDFYLNCPGLAATTVLFENISLYIENFSGTPYSDEENKILYRFGNVFQQTYTRFLDLQKAEAQAREAQIEAALERVRSRTMAMHKSEELSEVVFDFFKQMYPLGFAQWGFALMLVDEAQQGFNFWLSAPNGRVLPESYYLPKLDHRASELLWSAYSNQLPVSFLELKDEEKLSWDLLLFEKSGFAKFPDSVKKEMLAIHYVMGTLVSMRYGLMEAIDVNPLSVELVTILQRFAKVFEQTYTRFLDLQKAEAQARESQIQLALERVRAKAMAMQHSGELREIAAAVHDQLLGLGFISGFCSIVIMDRISGDMIWWMFFPGKEYPESYHMPFCEHPFYLAQLNRWKQGEKYSVIEVSGEEKKSYDKYTFSQTEFAKIPIETQQFMMSFDKIIFSNAYMKHGAFSWGVDPIDDAHAAVLQRFASVFEQCYTRFLDLQKAEAQAREAQIEAALEKVRSASLAMHHSHELQKVVSTLSGRLGEIGITFEGTLIFIFDREMRQITLWIASNHLPIPLKVNLPHEADMMNNPVVKDLWNAFDKGESSLNRNYTGKIKDDYFRYVGRHNFENIPQAVRQFQIDQPSFSISYVAEINSVLAIDSWEGKIFSNDEFNILKRFAKVFEQAYTRFLDLQKAEAQAREAQVEASLERVRSKTMAMHNSQDVGESVATLFDELVKLGLTTNRCGILIHNDEVFSEVWTAKSNANERATLIIGKLEITMHPMLVAARASWLNKEPFFSYELTGQDMINYYQAINNSKYYPTQFNLQALPSKEIHNDFHFAEGSLFAFTNEILPNESAIILKRFTSVFGQTYRRFLDLQKAEAQAREAKIEASLERVRGKAMAMHGSEDLAETIKVFYHELVSMSPASIIRCGAGVLMKEDRMADLSSVSRSANGEIVEVRGKLDMGGHPITLNVYNHWLVQKEYHHILRGNEIKEYYQYLRGQVSVPDYPSEATQYAYFPMFAEGSFYVFTENELTEEELKVYRRYTSVLSLTYKRYKDLRDAEARTQLAIRESSLDRVRAEIASMRTAEDLQRITPLVWHELTTLGVPFFRCGVFIINEEEKKIHTYLTNPQGKSLAALHLGFDSSQTNRNAVEHWRLQKVYTDHWDKEQFTAFAKSLIDQGQIETTNTYQGGDEPPESLTLQFIPFAQGMLYVGSAEPLSASQIELVQALAEAFSVAYARYEDFTKLELAKAQIEKTLTDLKQTQTQLIQSEKMASLGELTAGIAHEIQNPLNFVNNFSEVSTELVDEMNEELNKGNTEDAKLIAADLKQNLEKINHHGKRAGDIVKGMLQHSRSSSGVKEPTNINVLADEYLRLAYHGLRAKDKSFNTKFETSLDEGIGKVNVIPQDIGRVILNLITNAFYVVNERQKLLATSHELLANYEPTVSVSTMKEGNKVLISVKDNGSGIPLKILDKIFQPFFTTKPTGQGTGLGLSLSYDIVKAHGGELKVETQEGEGTTFIILLPIV